MILLSMLGSHGDLYPFLTVAKILKKQGEVVSFITSAAYQDEIESHSFSCHVLMSKFEHDQIIFNTNGEGILGNHKFENQFLICSKRIIYYIKNILKKTKIKIIITNIFTAIGVKILYEKYQIPYIFVQLTPFTVPCSFNFRRTDSDLSLQKSNILTKIFDYIYSQTWFWFRFFTVILPIRKMRKDLGINYKMKSMNYYAWLGEDVDRMIALFPRFFIKPLPVDWPIEEKKHIGFPIFDTSQGFAVNSRLEEFLSNKDKPIVLFARSTTYRGVNNEHKIFFAEAAKLCRLLNIKGLFIHLFEENIPTNLDNNFHYEKFVSYSAVFPRVDAVVHQGGIGTIGQAMQNAVPQLVVPFFFDQFANADFIEALGIGAHINQNEFTATHAVAKLKKLLIDVKTKKRCNKFARMVLDNNIEQRLQQVMLAHSTRILKK